MISETTIPFGKSVVSDAATAPGGGVPPSARGGALLDAAILLGLPLLAIGWRAALPDWAFMWALAAAIYFACKLVTLRRAATARRPAAGRALAYLLAWPGMDAAAFLAPRAEPRPPAPPPGEWRAAAAKAALGAALVWGATPLALPLHPHLAAWLGLAGVVLLLHFGAFHLLSLAWRRAGLDAPPIMDRPAAAPSLGEFWGRRWNAAFNRLAFDLAFRPARRRLGVAGATMLAFLVSGLIHDLVLSLPARGGYGLPTAYFLLQGAALLAERSRAGRRLGLGRGLGGRAFTLAIVAAPAIFLFHPPFLERVALPFLAAIGAHHPPAVAALALPSLATLVFVGGIVHLGILLASAAVPRVLAWRSSLASLDPLTRHLVWTHGAFIVLTIIGFGLISLLHAHALASGTPLARSLCGFIALFWAARLGVQCFVFDARPYLTTLGRKLGYHGLTAVFCYLALIYAWAALAPAGPPPAGF